MQSSSKALKFWAKFTKVYHSILIIPYEWDRASECPRLNPQKRLRALRIYVIQFLIILAYEAFLLYRGVQALKDEAESHGKKIKLLFSIAAYVLLNVNQWAILKHFSLYPSLLADFSRRLGRIRGNGGFEASKDRNLRIGLVAIAAACTTPAFARALDVLRNPEFPALLTSLFDAPRKLSMPVKLLIGYVHLHMNAFHYMNFAFNMMTLVYYYFGFVRLVRSLRLLDESHRLRSSEIASKVEKIARLHRELYIMQTTWNDMFGTWGFVVEVIAILSSTLNLFQAVVYSSFKGLSVGLLTMVVAFILFGLMADVYEESQGPRKSWSTVRVKWFVKFSRSARPLAVNVGSFYFADRQLLLTLLNIITSNTANLVLTYRS